MDKYTLSASEAALKIGMSKKKTLDLLNEGVLPGFREGRNWFISERALEEWCYRRSIAKAKERREKNGRRN